MEIIDPEEKKNRRISMITSLGFHAFLLILFFFLLAWSEPDPPIPQYGIELSFVQSNSTGKVESDQQEQSQQESVEEVQEAKEPVEEEPVQETSESSESKEAVEEEVVEETQAEPVEEAEVVETEDINSPDVVEEVKEETKVVEEKPKEVKEEKKPTENTKEKSETGKENSEEKPTENPTIDSRAIYTGSKGDTNSQSNSGGASLDLSGWIWDFEPEPDDKSDESGKIVFQIIVDSDGEIIGVKTLEKTVSPAVEKIYKDAVMDLTFSKTAQNRSVAATSQGKITFIIQSR
ncbi:hypothetical protein [Reichenbachiella sp. MALMAid0571]|uniref:hypothetical protein n=1 Tax=Reichenbachiella sp. MALMAid0571 TaxID=3143939 RepID=UPI0032DFD58E